MNNDLQEIASVREVRESATADSPCGAGSHEERRWAETVLAGEKRVLEIIAGGNPLGMILDSLCLVVEEVASGSLCSILLLDAKRGRLWQGAAPSLPKGYKEAFHGRPIASCWGPCGTAAFRKEQVVASDIQTDPLWLHCRDLVSSHGLRSCWSTPIFSSQGGVLGTFAILSREPRQPTGRDQKLIERFTHLASIAIERARGEEALRRSEAYLAEAQRLSHTGSFGWNIATGELMWSAETYCLLGYTRELTPSLELVLQRVHPEDLALVEKVIEDAARERTGLDFEHRVRLPNGQVRHLRVLAHPITNGSGEVELVGAVMDVTQRRRAEAVVAGEKRLLEMIARGGELAPILDEICRFGEQLSGDVLVSILLVSPDGKRLRHGAAPNLPRSYTDAIDGGLIGPDSGSCGTAAYREAPVIVADIRTDSLWEAYRPLALSHGLLACWSAPIFSTTREVIGTLALYSREPGQPTPQQRGVIEQMTHLAAVAIERKRAEAALRRSESRFEGILAIAEDAIISVDAAQRIVLFNQGAEKVFGYRQDELIGKPLDVLIPKRYTGAHHKSLEEFAKAPEAARVMGQRREVFGTRKSGEEFPAEASISKLDLAGDLVFTVILRDITERKQAAESLRASENFARGQAEALTQTLEALARESAPDRLAEHVLRTITEQLDAHSSSVWRRESGTTLLSFEFAFEKGVIVTSDDDVMAKLNPTQNVRDIHPWAEIFRTGKPSVLDDIREGADFPWRARLLAQGVVSILVVPMLIAGEVAGVIGIRFIHRRRFRAEELELAQALANQAMLAIQLTRLSAQSRESAVMAERNRMARDIHDTLAQGFTGVIVQLEAAADATSKGLPQDAENHLTRAGNLARESLREARRSVRALRPLALEQQDWCKALHGLLQKMTEGTAVRAQFTLQGEPRELPAEWEGNLLRIGQEVLTNAVRHAEATEFNTTVTFGTQGIRLELRDNGRGFDPAGRFDGFGLLGMRERVESMGGELSIQSALGWGTTIVIALPLTNEEQNLTS